MPKLVVAGAQLRCSEGSSPAALAVPKSVASDNEQLTATIMDHKPAVNIPPFGMCRCMANPQVASATAAAQGVLTPVPCLPVTTDPWSPGSSIVTVDSIPALTDSSTCRCKWTGVIEIVDPASDVDVD